MTEQPSTDEQKADWRALHERMTEARDREARFEQESLSYLRLAVRGDEHAAIFIESALNATRSAEAANADWAALYEVHLAHPYTAEIEARRAAKVEQ